MKRPPAPRCERCGRVIPARRRAKSDYCTDRCASDQAWDDEESARLQREEDEYFDQGATNVHTPRVVFESELGRDDPFKQTLERWLGREFPVLSDHSTESVMAAVVAEFISTKQYRVGPRPEPESEVMIRDVVRRHVEGYRAIPVLIPSAAVKLPLGAQLDLAELSALRVLACLNDRVKRYHRPGLAVRVRLEDLTELTISPDVPNVRALTEAYVRDFRNLVEVLGYGSWLTLVPESSLVGESAWRHEAQGVTQEFVRWLHQTADRPDLPVTGPLLEHGWKGAVSGALRAYLRDRYRAQYPEVPEHEHPEMMARYLAAILVRRNLGATGSTHEQRLEITFANPLPDAPRYSTRVQYRAAPRCQSSLALPYWAAKGYLALDEEAAPCIKLVNHRDQVPGLVRGQLTLTSEEGLRAELEADYAQD